MNTSCCSIHFEPRKESLYCMNKKISRCHNAFRSYSNNTLFSKCTWQPTDMIHSNLFIILFNINNYQMVPVSVRRFVLEESSYQGSVFHFKLYFLTKLQLFIEIFRPSFLVNFQSSQFSSLQF